MNKPAGDVRLTGAAELAQRLQQVADSITDWTPANRQAVEAIVDRARQLAPVRTGRLRSSIRATALTDDHATITVTAPYGVFANAQSRFWTTAIDAARPELSRIYAEHLASVFNRRSLELK